MRPWVERWRANKPAEIVARWFLLLSLKACGTHAHFWTFPIEWRCFSIAVWEHSIFSASSLVVWREFSCKSWFNRFSSNSTGRSEQVRLWGQNFIFELGTPITSGSMAPSLYTAQMSRPAFAALEPWSKKKEESKTPFLNSAPFS